MIIEGFIWFPEIIDKLEDLSRWEDSTSGTHEIGEIDSDKALKVTGVEGSDDEKKSLIVGCCALQFCWEDLAEIRSLAVHPDYQGKSIGSKLTKTALSEAKAFETKKIFTLTYRPKFFRRFGFVQIDRSELPVKIWADCITCVKFPDCDEIAMMKEIEIDP